MQTSTRHTSTAMETTAQMTLTESGQYEDEKSLDMVPSLGKNVSHSLNHKTAQVMMVKAVAIEHKSVDAPFISLGASELNIQSEDDKAR